MKYIKNIFIYLALITLPLFAIASPVVYAGNSCKKNFFGLPVWYKYLETTDSCKIITKDVANVPALVILGFIDIGLFLAGILAVLMIIWGGYKFILSDGSPDQIAGGRKTILNAVIGLIIVIFSAQIVNFIGTKLGGN